MKTCPHCHRAIPEYLTYCPHDGYDFTVEYKKDTRISTYIFRVVIGIFLVLAGLNMNYPGILNIAISGTNRLINNPTTNSGISNLQPIGSSGNIYFTSNRSGNNEIYRMQSDGKITRVTHTPNDLDSWAPAIGSSGNIYFTSNRSENNEIYRIQSDGKVSRVTHTPKDLDSWFNIKGDNVLIREPYNLQISSSDPMHYAGIKLIAGDRVSVIYLSGGWTIDYFNYDLTDANGYSSIDINQICLACRLPLPTNAPIGSLIGRVGNDKLFLIGNNLTFTVTQDGQLFLGINDDSQALGDNSGGINIKVIVFTMPRE